MKLPYQDNRPIVRLELQTKAGDYKLTSAYVDSGASYSIFHTSIAKLLGIKNVKGGKLLFFKVGNGEEIPGYIHQIPVKFAGKEFTANLAFSTELGIISNLLGLESFFERFCICFNAKEKLLEVTKL